MQVHHRPEYNGRHRQYYFHRAVNCQEEKNMISTRWVITYRIDETVDVGSNFWVHRLSLLERIVILHFEVRKYESG